MVIKPFSGDPISWMTFIDQFEATIDRSTQISDVEKFNYLLTYLEGDAKHTISGMGVTNANYKKALELLKNRFGNPQKIISAHMNELLKLKRITSDRDVRSIRKFYDDIESHVRSMDGLGVNINDYGALLAPVIIERLPHQLKLVIGRNIKDEVWDLTKILTVINDELVARENCIMSTDEKGGKNNLSENGMIENPFSGSALTSQQKTKNKCVFCKGSHWSDKCEVITDPCARKDFLKSAKRCFLCLKEGHLSRNCQNKRTCITVKAFIILLFVKIVTKSN